MNKAYLSLGSNEGQRERWLQQAQEHIAINCGTITATSPIYETAAWGITNQPDFLNMVLGIETYLSPNELLQSILNIETSLGRVRTVKWGPRTIDIDILFYNNEVINQPGLTIPHPFLQERRFILAPLAAIAPQYVHPLLHKTITQLLADCPDKLEVHTYIENQ